MSGRGATETPQPRWHRVEVERDHDGWVASIPTVDGCEARGRLRPEAVADCIARFRELTAGATVAEPNRR